MIMNMDDIVYQLDESAKRQLACAPKMIPHCLEYLAAREIEMLRHLVNEVIAIADNGITPDGDEVNIPTLLWAEEWKRKLTPNAPVQVAGGGVMPPVAPGTVS
jgi:hypothetical protein